MLLVLIPWLAVLYVAIPDIWTSGPQAMVEWQGPDLQTHRRQTPYWVYDNALTQRLVEAYLNLAFRPTKNPPFFGTPYPTSPVPTTIPTWRPFDVNNGSPVYPISFPSLPSFTIYIYALINDHS
jgi:hypothetical protein